MANPEESDDNTKDEAATPAEKKSLWTRFCSRKWLGTVISLTVMAHVSLIALQGVRGAKMTTRHTEISLGSFAFENQGDGGRLADAEFELHIRLLLDMEKDALIRLTQRRFKVEQDIEELLRQASGGDFDDPSLAELKRQLQERINQSLDMRAVSEVIITDLTLTRRAKSVAAAKVVRPTGPARPTVPTKPEQNGMPEQNGATELPEAAETDWQEKEPS